jgi:hypothetical protein
METIQILLIRVFKNHRGPFLSLDKKFTFTTFKKSGLAWYFYGLVGSSVHTHQLIKIQTRRFTTGDKIETWPTGFFFWVFLVFPRPSPKNCKYYHLFIQFFSKKSIPID